MERPNELDRFGSFPVDLTSKPLPTHWVRKLAAGRTGKISQVDSGGMHRLSI